MRTVDAALTAALAAGSGKPIAVAYIGYTDGIEIYHANAVNYKLSGLSLQVEIASTIDFGRDQQCVWLKRGLSIAGTDYTVTTGRFFIDTQEYIDGQHQRITGSLFPKQKYTAAGDDTYENVINAFCTAYGKTAVYKAADAWRDYQFLPDGKQIIMNDANHFLNLLAQKYLIHACDHGDEEVLFYCADVMGAADVTVTVKDDIAITDTSLRSRQFLWKDEAGSVHSDGTATDPIHNLGYLESTATCPARHAPTFEARVLIRPDLRIIDGDIVTINFYAGSATATIFAHPIEIFDPGKKELPWRLQLEANPIFHNTEAGALPSTIERVSNYTPLNTSMFEGVLSSSDNNLQAAMDTLDDHHAAIVDGTWTPTLTNVTNISASTAHVCHYLRLGSHVLVAGVVEINPTGAGSAQLDLSLPIASAFTATEDADGNATCPGKTWGSIIPDTVNDRLSLAFTATAAGNSWWRFVAAYAIK